MKTQLIIDLVEIEGISRSTVFVRNNTPYPQHVLLEVYRNNGTKSKQIEYEVETYSYKYFLGAELAENLYDTTGEYRVYITGPDEIEVFGVNGKVGEPAEKIFPEDAERPEASNAPVARLRSGAFFEYVGQPDCKYVTQDLYNAIQTASLYVYYKFPHKAHRQAVFGDACPKKGNCQGHGTAHKTRREVDQCFFVEEGKNYTQREYTPEGQSTSLIWSGDKLINFDGQRNWLLWKWLSHSLKDLDIMVDVRIIVHMRDKVDNKELFDKITTAAAPGWRQHDLHAHITYMR